MVVNGWTLLFHAAIIGQLSGLAGAYQRAIRTDPRDFRSNANVKLLAALAKLMFEVIPADPSRAEYRQGNTLGDAYRHRFRPRYSAASSTGWHGPAVPGSPADRRRRRAGASRSCGAARAGSRSRGGRARRAVPASAVAPRAG